MHLDISVLARPPRAVGNGGNVSPEGRHLGYGKLSRFDVSSNSRLSSLVIYNEFVFVEVKAYMVTIFALHHDDDLVAGV